MVQPGVESVPQVKHQPGEQKPHCHVDIGPGAQVHEAYVDVQSPSLDEVVAALPPGEPAVIVPLLLSRLARTADFEAAA